MEHVQSVISHVWPLWTLLCLPIKWRKYLPYLLFLGFPGRIKWKKVWKCLGKWKLNKWKILIVSPKVQSTWGKNCRNNRPEMPVCAKAKELDPGLRKCLTIQKCRAIACRYSYHALFCTYNSERRRRTWRKGYKCWEVKSMQKNETDWQVSTRKRNI